jgi:nitroreductase
MLHSDLERAIHVSQHCQRNWDLSKPVPDADLELFKTAIGQCPSKQNLAFYRAHLVTSRAIIEKIHARTSGFSMPSADPNEETVITTNPQVLANLLVVFEEITPDVSKPIDAIRNDQTRELAANAEAVHPHTAWTLERDRHMATGIAAGYLNLTASLLGYSTGCCACFDSAAIKEIMGLEGEPMLLMGIGFKNPEVGRRVHHADPDFLFPTKPKQPIEIRTVG